MSNIEKLYHRNPLASADALLTQEVGEFDAVMLMGYDANGRLRYCANKSITVAEIFLLMDSVKHDILTGQVFDRLRDV